MRSFLLLLTAFLLALNARAQTSVSGTVTDESGATLPGVNVVIVGTTTGTVTDIDGKFSLQCDPQATLKFSYISYRSIEVPVDGRTTVNVQMQADVNALEELVVVGYGTSSRRELTGAVSGVSAKSIERINPQRMDQALQGQAAGVLIQSQSGSPGGALNIRIRGLSSNGDNNPLILVDGVPYDAAGLNALNPADIESMNVLKDATAGIYGVRAANGVIVITTKKGQRNQKPTFSFDMFQGWQTASNRMSLLNAREYAVLKNESFAAAGLDVPFANTELGEGTDWQDEVFEVAPIGSYALTVTGGSAKSSYSIGGTILRQDGIVGGDKSGFDRENVRLNFTTELAPNVNFENVLLYSHETRRTLPENGIGSVLYNAVNASPVADPFDENGNFSYLLEVNDVINPLALMANTFNEANTKKITGKQEITYQANENLSVTGRVGYNYAIVDFKGFNPLVWYGNGKPQNTALNPDLDPVLVEVFDSVFVERNASVVEARTTYLDLNPEAFVTYERDIKEGHELKATLGTSVLYQQAEELSATAYGVPYNSYDYADISLADPVNPLNRSASFQTEAVLQSFFLRAEYDIQDRYLFSALVRRDQSSRFGPNNRVGYFPTASAAWLLSEESFFNSKAIDFMKLRASYGLAGNDKIGDFRYRALLGGEGIYPFNDQLVNGVAIGVLGNPDLKWETTEQFNIGTDLYMFDGRVNLSADFYNKVTYDLLFQPAVSGVLGAYGAGSAPPFVNGGDVRNRGFEFAITYNSPEKKKFSYSASYNLTTIDNEVLALPTGVDFIPGGAFGVGGATATRMEVGQPIGYFFGFQTDGIFQTRAEVDEAAVVQDGAQPGDLRFVDVNGDGRIDFSGNTDRTFLGSAIPKVTMGLNLTARYGAFDFSALLYSALGHKILRNYERQQPLANLLNSRIGRWTGPGSTDEEPRLTAGENLDGSGNNRNSELSDYFLEDGSFVRLRNIQLGFTVPNLAGKTAIQQLRVYVAANNLITLTRYQGFDPDIASGDPLASGIDYGFYPQARTIMVGASLKF